MPNPQLLQDAAAGDRRAQHNLYRHCFQLLMNVCMRYRSNESDAVSMLNLGFLKIVQNLEKYSPDVPFEAWCRRIMINLLIDDFRKNRKVRELMESRDFNASAHSADLVDFNEAALRLDAAQLEGMIKTLPPVSQKVFNLFAIDGYSHKEISEMLGMSDGTSKWHLSYARQRLREMLAKLEAKSLLGTQS